MNAVMSPSHGAALRNKSFVAVDLIVFIKKEIHYNCIKLSEIV